MRFVASKLARAALCAVVLPLAALPMSAQAPADPATMPAHDSHQDFTVAVLPYVAPQRYTDKFGKHTPRDAGIVGLDVYFRNDNDMPVRLNLQTIRLVVEAPGEPHQKLAPLASEEVADDVLLTPPKDPTQRKRLPTIGTGLKPNRDKNWQEFNSLLRSVSMAADIIGPHTTVHGFFYFDINSQYGLLSDARLDVSDLSFMGTNKALLFFEVDLAPAVH
jgi:hypothetical protein